MGVVSTGGGRGLCSPATPLVMIERADWEAVDVSTCGRRSWVYHRPTSPVNRLHKSVSSVRSSGSRQWTQHGQNTEGETESCCQLKVRRTFTSQWAADCIIRTGVNEARGRERLSGPVKHVWCHVRALNMADYVIKSKVTGEGACLHITDYKLPLYVKE